MPLLRTALGELIKLCVRCDKALPLAWSFSLCSLCLMFQDEGGG